MPRRSFSSQTLEPDSLRELFLQHQYTAWLPVDPAKLWDLAGGSFLLPFDVPAPATQIMLRGLLTVKPPNAQFLLRTNENLYWLIRTISRTDDLQRKLAGTTATELPQIILEKVCFELSRHFLFIVELLFWIALLVQLTIRNPFKILTALALSVGDIIVFSSAAPRILLYAMKLGAAVEFGGGLNLRWP